MKFKSAPSGAVTVLTVCVATEKGGGGRQESKAKQTYN